MFETFQAFSFHFFLSGSPNCGVVRLVVFDQVPKDAGEFVGHGGDGFWGTQPGFPAAETIAHIVFAAPEALGRQAECHGCATLNIPRSDRDDSAAGDSVVWTEAQPGGEAFGGGKFGDEVWSQLVKRTSAVPACMPGTWVRSTPRILYSSARALKAKCWPWE